MANIKFYLDEMMPSSVAEQLTVRGYEIVRAVNIGMTGQADEQHLRVASDNGALLVTGDKPFAGIVSKQALNHAGLICWTGAQNDFGGMVRRLTEFASAHAAEDVAGKVFWLK